MLSAFASALNFLALFTSAKKIPGDPGPSARVGGDEEEEEEEIEEEEDQKEKKKEKEKKKKKE